MHKVAIDCKTCEIGVYNKKSTENRIDWPLSKLAKQNHTDWLRQTKTTTITTPSCFKK